MHGWKQRTGRPAAIIIGIDDFEGMEMTMDILRPRTRP